MKFFHESLVYFLFIHATIFVLSGLVGQQDVKEHDRLFMTMLKPR